MIDGEGGLGERVERASGHGDPESRRGRASEFHRAKPRSVGGASADRRSHPPHKPCPPFHAQLNTLGQLCPQPIIETAKAIKKVKKGQILEILSDDWGMKTDLPAWCMMTGHQLLEMIEGKDLIRCRVKKVVSDKS